MPSSSTDLNNLPRRDSLPQRPEDLPRGLLTPPERVRQIVDREAARFPPAIFTPEARERLTIDLTLQSYFEEAGYEVAYRSTAQGPEVLAVGWEEVAALRKRLTEADEPKVHIWQP